MFPSSVSFFKSKGMQKNEEESLIIGFNLVAAHKEQGIPKEDLQRLWDYARENDLVIMFRPVEVIAKSLLEEGMYPTKDFNIKGKSASWGAWAGFIPKNQAYSKHTITDVRHIDKLNKEVEKCVKDKYAIFAPLSISEKRYLELVEKKFIIPQVMEEGLIPLFCPRPGTEEKEIVYAKKKENTEYEILTREQTPFLVLADTKLQKPLIPDYDLLAIIPRWEVYGVEDIPPNPDITYTEYQRKRPYLARLGSRDRYEEAFLSREIRNLGNVSERVVKQIIKINQALGKKMYLDRIHHNEDVGSPASNLKSNFPITVFFPPAVGVLSEVLLIKTPEAFEQVLSLLSKKGYRVKTNPLWDNSLKYAGKIDFWQRVDYFNFLESMSIYLNDEMKNLLKEIKYTPLFEDVVMLLKKSDASYMSTWLHGLTVLKQVGIFSKMKDSVLKFAYECIEYNPLLMTAWVNAVEFLANKGCLTETTCTTFLKFFNDLKNDLEGAQEIVAALRPFSNYSSNKFDKEALINKLFSAVSESLDEVQLDRLAFKYKIKELKQELEILNKR